ncbi:MAG: arginine--tRNA ligase [Planctomycetota bacterium]
MTSVSPLESYERRVAAALAKLLGAEPAAIALESPRDASHGDIAFPCFKWAKERGAAPNALAAELQKQFNNSLVAGISAKATGPFLNFVIDKSNFAAELLPAAFGEGFGGMESNGQSVVNKTIVVDYSSPNIAKRFHVGHLRSTVIGAAVKRICELRGYKTIGINHIGDWGSQFGKLLTALRRFGSEAELDRLADGGGAIEYLQEIYVQYHTEEKKSPEIAQELSAESRKWFLDLESGNDNEARRLWKKLTLVSLAEFDKLYKRLGVSFDLIRGESAYESDLAPTIEMCKKAGITKISEGALVVDIEGQEKPALLQTGDGTTLYLTRDLASVFYRKNTLKFTKAVYVVGNDQRDHFKELKAVVKRLGHAWSDDIIHADFGMMRLPEGKMSTRAGNVIILNDVLESAVERVREVIQQKNPDINNPETIAEQVGIGAVIFNDLKQDRRRDVIFRWDDVLNFDGETGPYCQYTHARLASIIRKSGMQPSPNVEFKNLADAGPLLLAIARFPVHAALACERYEPHAVAQSALEIAKNANAFYRDHRVLDAGSPELVAARLAIVEAARRTLSKALALLGVASPAEM